MEEGFGKRLHNRRAYVGMTQDELAKRLGYSDRAAISNIENGKNGCPMSIARKMADILDCSFNWLWYGTENPNEEDKLSPKPGADYVRMSNAKDLSNLSELEQAMLGEFNKLGTMDKIKAINYVQELNNKK